MSLPARIAGVLFAPRATYAAIAARPQWFGAIACVIIAGALATSVFMSTEVGRQAAMDQQMDFMKAFNVQMTDQQYERMQQGMRYAPYTAPIGQIVFVAVISLIVAGIMLGIFNAVLGGDAQFKQVYAVVAHSYVITVVSTIARLSLGYTKGTMSGVTNLAVFLPFLDENAMAARFLGAIDLFAVWWVVSLSIGLGVLFKRRTGPIASTMLGIYVVVALVYALIRTAFAGA